jgi:hypothetical protein
MPRPAALRAARRTIMRPGDVRRQRRNILAVLRAVVVVIKIERSTAFCCDTSILRLDDSTVPGTTCYDT